MRNEKNRDYPAVDEPELPREWDGIREQKNDPPRWWLAGFYLSAVFIVCYLLLYPAIPLITGWTKGILGWTYVAEYNRQIKKIEAMRAPFEHKIEKLSATEILEDPALSEYALASTRVLFGDNCAPCHGPGGRGGPGFPILNDDDWLYGGAMETIIESITDGRQGVMPAHEDILTAKELDDVARFVKELSSGRAYEPGRAVFMGETKGEAECAGCHGPEGRGNPDMGATNLTDSIWRFYAGEEEIRRTIRHGVNVEDDPLTRKARMPAFGDKLSANQIKKLAVRVSRL